jgi:adenosine deaminase
MLDRRRVLAAAVLPAAAGLLKARPAVAATDDADMAAFIAALPKAELHVHLEGTLEAEMKFALARRNGVRLPYPDVAAMRRSYVFHDLPSFLAVYYEGKTVLVTEQDFYDLTLAYLTRAAAQNVLHAEMFFDPQQHVSRGIPLALVIGGISRARRDARVRFGIGSGLIMCFMRELSAADAGTVLDAALPLKQHLVGVGLDSDERGAPPAKFAAVFAKARAAGLKVTVHCDIDQVDTHDHIRQAIEDIGVDRVDHGGNVLQRPELIALARRHDVAFTVCPVYSGWLTHAGPRTNVVRGMLDHGLKATINSDDPAYMGGAYIGESMVKAQADSRLTRAELVALSRNAFQAAWIGEAERARYLARLDAFAGRWAAPRDGAL